MEVKCNITTKDEFEKAVAKVSMEFVKEFDPSQAFIIGMANMIFAKKLREELFGGSEVEDD